MVRAGRIIDNQRGSVIVVAMIMLVLLTLIGISSSRTSTTEVQIATHNQNYHVEFYLADSGWRQGALWLENQGSPPQWVNGEGDDFTVKNFGFGTAPDGEGGDLGSLAPDNNLLSSYGIPYWYRVDYLDPVVLSDAAVFAEGNEKGFERFHYEITSNANTTQQIEVRVSKVFKVGYN
ncbi:MAG: PilX N-terminal domain-containing pilus assembly protein [Desulfobacterales bacterium]